MIFRRFANDWNEYIKARQSFNIKLDVAYTVATRAVEPCIWLCVTLRVKHWQL